MTDQVRKADKKANNNSDKKTDKKNRSPRGKVFACAGNKKHQEDAGNPR